MVLLDMHLYNPAAERVAITTSSAACNGNVLPANRVTQGNFSKLNQVVMAGAGIEDDMSGCVRFVLVVVDVKSNGTNFDAAQEVDGK